MADLLLVPVQERSGIPSPSLAFVWSPGSRCLFLYLFLDRDDARRDTSGADEQHVAGGMVENETRRMPD
jgi:hypothetical protein